MADPNGVKLHAPALEVKVAQSLNRIGDRIEQRGDQHDGLAAVAACGHRQLHMSQSYGDRTSSRAKAPRPGPSRGETLPLRDYLSLAFWECSLMDSETWVPPNHYPNASVMRFRLSAPLRTKPSRERQGQR